MHTLSSYLPYMLPGMAVHLNQEDEDHLSEIAVWTWGRSWVHKNLTGQNHHNHLPPDFLCVKGKSLLSCLACYFGFQASQVAQPANAGDTGSIPGSGRSSGEGSGNLIQYSSLENPMDRETWWATVHGVAKSWT